MTHVSFSVSFVILAEPHSPVLEIQLFQPTQPCPGVPRRLWQVGTEQGVAGGAEALPASTGCPLLTPIRREHLMGKCSSSSHQVRAMGAGRCHTGKFPSLGSGQKSQYVKTSSQRHLAKLGGD